MTQTHSHHHHHIYSSDLEYSVVAKCATQRLRVDVWRDVNLATELTTHRLVAAYSSHNKQTEP